MAEKGLNEMKKILKRAWTGFLLAAAIVMTLSTTGCNGNVYVGVGIAGPYHGYPYGPYGYPVGGVVVGRPFY
jgi:hypothetical protein